MHSDWPLYDIEGQNGHIHDLTLSYVKNIAPGLYGRAQAGLLEPFFAGVGGEITLQASTMAYWHGIDIHRVRKRDYDMRFDLRDYETTVGHLSFIMMQVKCLMLKSTPVVIWRATGARQQQFPQIWQRLGSWRLRDTDRRTI